MNLIGYNRVSTQEQADHGVSLALQPAAAERWCEAMGHTLVEVVNDPAVSAGKKAFADRAGGKRVIEALKAGEADGVICLSFDRMFRIAVDGLNSAEWFMHNGYAVLSIREAIDITNNAGWMTFGIMCLTSEYERRVIVQRAKETSQGLREQSKVYGGIPYGCVEVDGQLFKNPEIWPLRNIIVGMYKGGAGKSSRKIASHLRAQQIAPPGGFKKGGESTETNLWHHTTVLNIIKTHHDFEHIPYLPDAPETSVSGADSHSI